MPSSWGRATGRSRSSRHLIATKPKGPTDHATTAPHRSPPAHRRARHRRALSRSPVAGSPTRRPRTTPARSRRSCWFTVTGPTLVVERGDRSPPGRGLHRRGPAQPVARPDRCPVPGGLPRVGARADRAGRALLGGGVVANAATGNTNVKALVYIDAFIPDEGQVPGELNPGTCLETRPGVQGRARAR